MDITEIKEPLVATDGVDVRLDVLHEFVLWILFVLIM